MARAFSGMRYAAGSNPNPSGVQQGTLGGRVPSSSRPGRTQVMLGDEMYLWILILLEVGAMTVLRNQFRRYHGG